MGVAMYGQVNTWEVLVDCGPMHRRHATTKCTQSRNILKENGRVVRQEGEAEGRP
jgi:hypothetical protein